MPKKMIRKTLKVLIMLSIGILIVGSIIQYRYDVKVTENHQPNGQFVNLEYGKAHYKFLGSGQYTLVLEAGLGENLQTWSKIEDSLTQLGKVFMYDRAGLGYSDESNQPRTSSQIAKELKELLDKANVPGPYLLIGHSIGGVHLRYFAHLYPENIAGLFLIDPSHENMKPDDSDSNVLDPFYHFSLKYLSKTGIPFLIMPKFLHPINKTSKNIKTYGFETDGIDASFSELRQAKKDLSQLPMYIIYANDKTTDTSRRDLLQELVDNSKSGIKKLIEYKKPHYIHVSDPNIVLNDLRTFINKIEAKKAKVNIEE